MELVEVANVPLTTNRNAPEADDIQGVSRADLLPSGREYKFPVLDKFERQRLAGKFDVESRVDGAHPFHGAAAGVVMLPCHLPSPRPRDAFDLSSVGTAGRSVLARIHFIVRQGVVDGDWTCESRYGEARGQLPAEVEDRRKKMSMCPFGRLLSGQRNPREHLNACKGAFDDTMRALL